MANHAQIVAQNKISAVLQAYRRRRKKIVFTNGVFDILHRGHVQYLTKAKSLGDVLVVGLNTDASVRRLKGKLRPIQNQKDRAVILSALRMVDLIILFSEDTPEKLIRMVRPNVLVKGADYKVAEIVGADFVRSYGGKVRRIRLTPGRSTTRIIRASNTK